MNDKDIDVFISHDDLMDISPEYRSIHNKEMNEIYDFYKKSIGVLSYTYLLYKLCQQSGLADHVSNLKKIQTNDDEIWKKVHKEFSSHNTNE